ncbi:hypothetical protein BKI52_35360 [marine bacterium AO1-C]|nr:hypothetical protein BKI52_35360 [marine bacterium AO1-C]
MKYFKYVLLTGFVIFFLNACGQKNTSDKEVSFKKSIENQTIKTTLNEICKCYFTSFRTTGIDFQVMIDSFEEYLINEGHLKSREGASLKKFINDIIKQKEIGLGKYNVSFPFRFDFFSPCLDSLSKKSERTIAEKQILTKIKMKNVDDFRSFLVWITNNYSQEDYNKRHVQIYLLYSLLYWNQKGFSLDQKIDKFPDDVPLPFKKPSNVIIIKFSKKAIYWNNEKVSERGVLDRKMRLLNKYGANYKQKVSIIVVNGEDN